MNHGFEHTFLESISPQEKEVYLHLKNTLTSFAEANNYAVIPVRSIGEDWDQDNRSPVEQEYLDYLLVKKRPLHTTLVARAYLHWGFAEERSYTRIVVTMVHPIETDGLERRIREMIPLMRNVLPHTAFVYEINDIVERCRVDVIS